MSTVRFPWGWRGMGADGIGVTNEQFTVSSCSRQPASKNPYTALASGQLVARCARAAPRVLNERTQSALAEHPRIEQQMKKWFVVLILGAAQFVMVLDGTVMNVSISTVVEDLDSTVTAMQTAITFYTLTMAALMLLGAKLGDIWGRRRALVIGSIIYAIGSGHDRSRADHGRPLPRLVDHRGPRRRAGHPGGRGAHRRQLRGSRPDHGVRRHRRRLRRGRRRRPAHRRLPDDVRELAGTSSPPRSSS